MGEDVYNGLYISFTIAATIASIVGNVYLRKLAGNAKVATQATRNADSAESIKYSFGDEGKLSQHFDKHVVKGKEFGNLYSTKEEYLQGANDLINSKSNSVQTFVRKGGG